MANGSVLTLPVGVRLPLSLLSLFFLASQAPHKSLSSLVSGPPDSGLRELQLIWRKRRLQFVQMLPDSTEQVCQVLWLFS